MVGHAQAVASRTPRPSTGAAGAPAWLERAGKRLPSHPTATCSMPTAAAPAAAAPAVAAPALAALDSAVAPPAASPQQAAPASPATPATPAAPSSPSGPDAAGASARSKKRKRQKKEVAAKAIPLFVDLTGDDDEPSQPHQPQQLRALQAEVEQLRRQVAEMDERQGLLHVKPPPHWAPGAGLQFVELPLPPPGAAEAEADTQQAGQQQQRSLAAEAEAVLALVDGQAVALGGYRRRAGPWRGSVCPRLFGCRSTEPLSPLPALPPACSRQRVRRIERAQNLELLTDYRRCVCKMEQGGRRPRQQSHQRGVPVARQRHRAADGHCTRRLRPARQQPQLHAG